LYLYTFYQTIQGAFMLEIDNDSEKISTDEIKQLVERVYTLNVNPFDAFVGFMIKKRRKHLNLSQQQVGFMLGVTFQQIQKYEKGFNRISAERLWDIAHLFQTEYDYFFQNINEFLKEFDNPKLLPACYNISQNPISFEEDDILKIMSKLDAFHNKTEPKAMPDIKDIANQINELTDSAHIVAYLKNFSVADFNAQYERICKKLPKSEQKKYQQAMQLKKETPYQLTEEEAFEKLLKAQANVCASNENEIETIVQETKKRGSKEPQFKTIRFIKKEG